MTHRWLKGALGLLALGLAEGCGPAPASQAKPQSVTTASGVPMIVVPTGLFQMGSDDYEVDEGPQHEVRISSFLMDQFEVTHDLFVKAQLPNPSRWQDDIRKPVERVRWREAKLYCNERSLMEGLTPCYDEAKPGWPCDFAANGYRLPTEAEWEYAARAGTGRLYSFGAPAKLKANGWFADNAGQRTHVVGTRRPNAWGLHDLYGNVSEWCQDVYEPDYYKRSPAADPLGPAGGAGDTRRVMKGGSWKASASMCRASFRKGQRTGDTDACFFTDFCGFRCVRRVTPADVLSLLAKAASEK